MPRRPASPTVTARTAQHASTEVGTPAGAGRAKPDFPSIFAASQIDGRSASPKYSQISVAIREKILSSVLRKGDPLPSEAEMMELFDVSRITARRATEDLVASGLALRHKGRATVVAFEGNRHRQRGSIEDLLENLLILGERTAVSVEEFEYAPAGSNVATLLQIAVGDEVQRVLRIRHEDGEPLSLIETWVPGDIGRRISRADLERSSLQALFRSLGIEVARADQTFSAQAVLGRQAKLLDVEVGSPVFRISRVVFDATGRPVEYVVALYRSDRYDYRMSLVQSRGRWTQDK